MHRQAIAREEAQRQPTILIVDDDREFARAAAELLTDGGFRVLGTALTAGEARQKAARLRPDAILLDVRLPDGNGIALARELCGGPDAPKVLLTSSDPNAVPPKLVGESGAVGFVPKTALARSDLAEFFNR